MEGATKIGRGRHLLEEALVIEGATKFRGGR